MTLKKLLRDRFEGKHDYIKWELDDKKQAFDLVSTLGFLTPDTDISTSYEEAFALGLEKYHDEFVVKASGGHSAFNVFLVKRSIEGTYINLINLKPVLPSLPKKDIIGKKPDYWITESMAKSYVAGSPIPYDYKCYCFEGRIATIVQIDRNCSPPQASAFDGNFIPLTEKVDYSLNESRWKYGKHVLPINAAKILHMASELSLASGADFVRIDLFDTVQGPVFGEFTFAPGDYDVGMIVFSDKINSQLDSYLSGYDQAISGFHIDQQKVRQLASSMKTSSLLFDEFIMEKYSQVTKGHNRYNEIFTPKKDELFDLFQMIINIISYRNGNTPCLFSVCTTIKRGTNFSKASNEFLGLHRELLDYYKSKRETSSWDAVRLEQVMVTFFGKKIEEALSVISMITKSDSDSKYAKDIKTYYEKIISDRASKPNTSLFTRVKQKIKKA